MNAQDFINLIGGNRLIATVQTREDRFGKPPDNTPYLAIVFHTGVKGFCWKPALFGILKPGNEVDVLIETNDKGFPQIKQAVPVLDGGIPKTAPPSQFSPTQSGQVDRSHHIIVQHYSSDAVAIESALLQSADKTTTQIKFMDRIFATWGKLVARHYILADATDPNKPSPPEAKEEATIPEPEPVNPAEDIDDNPF